MPDFHISPQPRPHLASAIRIGLAGFTGAISLAVPALAQDAPDMPRAGEALSSMIGSWEGTGWSMMPDGSRETFDIFERVESVGAGHAVMIRGEGFSPTGSGRDGRLVHDAGGVISLEADGYEMFAATARGGPEAYAMTISETGYVWEIPLGPQGGMVFTAVITEDSWAETGEYCPPQGDCLPTLSMTLNRIAE